MDTALPWISADQLSAHIPVERARELVVEALRSGFDPADDPQRGVVPAGAGHLLLMPATIGDWVGTKVASVAPDNPEQGLPRIQAVFLLMDAATLTPTALIEGSTLTALRTPAVSAAAADLLAPPDAERLVVFGTGPQAWGHVRAMAQIRTLRAVAVNGRDPERTEDFRTRVSAELGLEATLAEASDVEQADVVVCATTSPEAVFDGSLVTDGACVVAVGSHEPEFRELDEQLMQRSLVVVEDTETALREAGDVIRAGLAGEALTPLRALVTGDVVRATDRPNVFKGVGMSWQDLAVAIGVTDLLS